MEGKRSTMKAPRDVSYESTFIHTLTDPQEAAEYLAAIIELNDQGALLVGLRHVAKAHGMKDVAARAELGEKTLFKSLNENGNPTIETISKVLATMGLRLTVEPLPA